jgi:hypothetical protein
MSGVWPSAAEWTSSGAALAWPLGGVPQLVEEGQHLKDAEKVQLLALFSAQSAAYGLAVPLKLDLDTKQMARTHGNNRAADARSFASGGCT